MFWRSASLVITAALMGGLAITAVALRMMAVKARGHRVGAADYLILFGLVRLISNMHIMLTNWFQALALGLCVCNIVGAVCFRFGNHEIYIASGELEGFPVAWMLLGYGKVSSTHEIDRSPTSGRYWCFWLDILCNSTPAYLCNANNQSIASPIPASDFRPQQEFPHNFLDSIHLRFSLVAHNILDECIPMLAHLIKLGHESGSVWELYSWLHCELQSS